MTAPCPVCDGEGVVWHDDVLKICAACDGSGEVRPVTLAPVPTDDEVDDG